MFKALLLFLFFCVLMSILSLFLSDLSVLAAAGGKTQDSAKVKGEKDLDINVDWSETDYSCSDDEFTSEEIYPMDEEKGLLQLQTDGNTNEIGGETTDSDDFQRHRINSEKDEKDGYEKKEVVQENQRAKCKGKKDGEI